MEYIEGLRLRIFKDLVNDNNYKIVKEREAYFWEYNNKENRLYNQASLDLLHDIYKKFIEKEYVATDKDITNVERHLYHYYLERYYLDLKTDEDI